MSDHGEEGVDPPLQASRTEDAVDGAAAGAEIEPQRYTDKKRRSSWRGTAGLPGSTACGPLSIFIKSAAKGKNADPLAKALAGVQHVGDDVEHQSATSVFARRERLREILVTDVMVPITRFFKDRRDVAWLFNKATILAHVRVVSKLARASVGLGESVDLWIAKKASGSQAAAKDAAGEGAETTQEKQDRLKSFWAHYHQPPRILEDKSARMSEAPTPSGFGMLSSMATSSASGFGSTSGFASPGYASSSGFVSPRSGDEHRRLGMTDMSWKIRGARSRTSLGNVTFDPGGGLQLGRGVASNASVTTSEPRPSSRGELKKWMLDAFQTRQPRGSLPTLPPVIDSPKMRPKSRDSGARGGCGSASSLSNSHGDCIKSSASKRRVWWWKAGEDPQGSVPSPFCLGTTPTRSGLSASRSLPELRGNGRRGSLGGAGGERPGSRSEHRALPPIEDTFVPPHGKVSRGAVGLEGGSAGSPTAQYLQACDRDGLVPMPVPLLTGQSTKLNSLEIAMGDHDLLAMANNSCIARIEDVDFGGRMLLSDSAIGSFLKSLMNVVQPSSLQRLSMRSCPHAGVSSQDAVLLLLGGESAKNLRHLDLGGVPLLVRHHLPLCKAIGQHPRLEYASLADTGMGSNPSARLCVVELPRSDSLKALDLGWNCFTPAVLSDLGAAVVERGVLETVSLASCAALTSMSSSVSGIVDFLEHLRGYDTIKCLDISLNRIDFRGALIIEDVLDDCRGLRELDVSNNPLRVLGIRSILRLLSRDSNALMHFRCDGCYASDVPEPVESRCFNSANPAGRYMLDLSQSYDRTFFRMLCKTCVRFGVTLESAMRDMSCSPPPYQQPQKDARGLWHVPYQGKVTMTFSMEDAMDRTFKGLKDYDFKELLERYRLAMFLQPHVRKSVPMISQWKSLDGRVLEQRIMLQALAHDFTFTYPQLHQFCQSKGMEADVISSLMPRLLGGDDARFLMMRYNMKAISSYIVLFKRADVFLRFNPDNPTGHYRLDLANPMSHCVAASLMVVDEWEAGVSRRLKRPDTSQCGNWSRARNLMFQHKPLRKSLVEWSLPERDTLELDYCSSRRPPPGAVMLDDATFDTVLLVLQLAVSTDPHLVLDAMRSVSHLVYVSAMHLRQLLGIFRGEQDRGDALVCWFSRAVDMHNEKIFRVRFENPAELAKLRSRLGFAVFFPFIQPEQSSFELNFANYDERLAGSILMSLATKETVANLRKYSYQLANGTFDPLPLGVPRSWEIFEKIPKEGIFRVTYACAPEDRNFKLRKDLQEKFGLTEVTAQESEVMWWAALQEAPDDVLELLYFIRAKYSSFDAAFAVIDGPDGNGSITWKELEEGYHKMKCKKFADKDERQRIQEVFRYLDPSRDGSVSKGEFAVIDQFWNELLLSMRELVQFCERTFGDLENTWNMLDEDGGGEITMEEWTDALQDVGYFGPSQAIFNFLDDDDGGAITFEELEKMSTFK